MMNDVKRLRELAEAAMQGERMSASVPEGQFPVLLKGTEVVTLLDTIAALTEELRGLRAESTEAAPDLVVEAEHALIRARLARYEDLEKAIRGLRGAQITEDYPMGLVEHYGDAIDTALAALTEQPK